MRRYRCAHCLQELPVDESGNPEQCPHHPDGGVEIEEQETDGV